MTMANRVNLPNLHLACMQSDFLYHLNIIVKDTKDTADIKAKFGDVKFVCMGGTKSRMLQLANYLSENALAAYFVQNIEDVSKADRYTMYKIGPVLCCSHGLGMPSFSVVLHELLKLVKYAECIDPIFIRVGTCGGLGVEAGTVIVTIDAYNGLLENCHEIAILGKRIKRPANFDRQLANAIVNCAKATDKFRTVAANTISTECFYEGQGRLDGASCNYKIEEKMAFLNKCYNEYNINNIEMEATMFSSLTKFVNVKSADICVALLNRLKGDQIEIAEEQKVEFETYPFIILNRFIRQSLQQN